MTHLIVCAEFNEMITGPMLQDCLKGFAEQNLAVEVIKVPGSVEIPLAVKLGIEAYKPESVVVLGCLIKGETDHYDAICRMVEQGIMQLTLEYRTPIVFEVLMTDTYQKAEARINKGYHAAFVASQMAELKKTVSSPTA